MRRYKCDCDRCESYYSDSGQDFEYIICEKCGRLLVGAKRYEEIMESSTLRRICYIGEDSEAIWSIRRALFDPRYYVSSCECFEILRGINDLNGGQRICSKDGDAAEELIISRSQLDISLMCEERPTITILVLDCSKKEDISDYISFLRDHIWLMNKIRPRYRNPVVVVLAGADRVTPSSIKAASDYTDKKKQCIQDAVEYCESLFREAGVAVDDVFPVASYVEWKVIEGRDTRTGVRAEDLEIAVDGRFNIDRLRSWIAGSVIRKVYS